MSGLRRCIALIALVASALVAVPADRADAQELDLDVDLVNEAFGVGVNLGNALEAPREGDWGLTLEADFFVEIADAGFGHVRVPIKFSEYADASAPYLIPEGDDPSIPNAANLWERVDWVIEQAEANGLFVIIDVHHYDELHADVAGHRDRFLAIWSQIATRYSDAGPLVVFEALNEPNGQFDDDPTLLNDLLADVVTLIRTTNPTRPILVGPGRYNGIGALDDLVLPADDNLIASIHFYDPFEFTHQGADWVDPILPSPVEWDADQLRVGSRWQNWSWDTELTATSTTVTATFAQQFAGLQFARLSEFDPALFRMTASGINQFSIRCVDGDDNETDLGTITTGAVRSRYSRDMTDCPADTTRFYLFVQSASFNPLVLWSAELCEEDGTCTRLIETEAEAVESRLEQAASWAEANGVPLNVGEFGVYGANGDADLGERAEWTDFVRRAARSLGMSTTYWEFGAGFGAYDPALGSWIEPLQDALLDGDAAPGMIGDVTCDARMDINDALVIAQFAVNIRGDIPYCPLSDGVTEIHARAGDLDRSGRVDIVDALLIARCVVGIVDEVCPTR